MLRGNGKHRARAGRRAGCGLGRVRKLRPSGISTLCSPFCQHDAPSAAVLRWSAWRRGAGLAVVGTPTLLTQVPSRTQDFFECSITSCRDCFRKATSTRCFAGRWDGTTQSNVRWPGPLYGAEMDTRKPDRENVYAAAEAWVERALRSDDSLFTPGRRIWTTEWLEELHHRFLDSPDVSDMTFMDKLERQLAGSPPEAYQLMAEVLFVHFIVVSRKDSTGVQAQLRQVLNWSPQPVAIPSELVAGLTPGIANPGQGVPQVQATSDRFRYRVCEPMEAAGTR